MERAMVAVVGALLLLAGFAAPGECMNCYPGRLNAHRRARW